jgi:vitamin B12 transporter
MKNKIILTIVVTFVAAFFTTTIKSEPLEVWIYAERTPSYLAPVTYSYEIVESEDIKDVANLDIVTSGPKGQVSSLYIRGADSDQNLITLNGIPIKDHSSPTGTDDIGQHNFTGISSVEIIKGPMSSVYGANASGGVINLISDVSYNSYATLSVGSNNSSTKKVQVSDISNRLAYTISAEQQSTDGISVYPGGSETDPYDSTNYNLNFMYYGDIANYRLNFINELNNSNLDGITDTEDYTGKWHWTNLQFDANTNNSRFAFNNSNHNRTYTKDGLLEGNYKSNTNTFLASHILNFNKADVTIGAEHENVDANFLTNIRGAFPYTSSVDKTRNTNGIFVNTNILTEDNFIISTGLRYDSIDEFGNKVTGRYGLHKNGYRGSVSLGYRIPTLYEMYGQDNYGFNGNPNLKEEDTIGLELGYNNDIFDTAVFVTQESNAIIYDGTYVNDADKSYTKGIETSINHSIDDYFITGNVAFTDARKSNGGQKLRRPKLTSNVKVARIINGIEYSTKANYYGKHKDIDSKTFATIDKSSVITYDAELKHLKDNVEIFAGIYNISNKEYERPDGYSQLGRNWKAGFKVYF